MQVQLQRRFSDGLSLAANYTLGRALSPNENSSWLLGDHGTQALAYRDRNLAPTSTDRRHNLGITSVWQIPVGGGVPTALVCGAPFVQISGLTFFNNALYITDAGNRGNTNGPGAIYKVDLSVRLSSPNFTSNRFQFRLTAPAGTYIIQASTNLMDWEAIFTNSSPALPFTFTDTNTAAFPTLFYRVQLAP